MIYLTALLLLLATPKPPAVDASSDLRLAAAELRVGLPEPALARLAALPTLTGEADLIRRILEARAALLAGKTAQAKRALKGVKQPPPGLAPVIAYLKLEIARQEGSSKAIVKAAHRLGNTPDCPELWKDQAALRAAEADLKAGHRAAINALKKLATDGSSDVRPKAWLILAGQPGELGRKAQVRLLVGFGATTEGRAAAKLLDPTALTAEQQLARARNLFSDRAYEEADPAFERAAAGEAAPEVKQEAAFYRAIIRLRLFERYDEAKKLLAEARLGPDPKRASEAGFYQGILLGRMGKFEEASAAMAAIAPELKGQKAIEAQFQVGRSLHQAGRFVEAAQALETFTTQAKLPDPPKWRFFAGWSWFRAGRYADARRVFSELEGNGNLLIGPKALYWIARCYLAEGNQAEAKATLRRLSERAPLGYYGLLGQHLAHTALGDPRALPPRPAGLPVKPDTTADLLALTDLLPKDDRPFIEKAARLVAVGYPREARLLLDDHFDKRRLKKLKRKLSKEDYLTFEQTMDLGLERYRARYEKGDGRRLPWQEGFARRSSSAAKDAYQPAYLDLVRAAGAKHGVSPWWLLAHMLQESRYGERAVSHAGALGPMQILPRTGRIIAEKVGFPSGDFFESALFDPGVAVRHAAFYLDALRTEHGHTIAAMGAYNGGPRRMAAHAKESGSLPFDIAMEEIGAHETRNYARKVTDHLVRFATLYADDAEREALLTALLPPKNLANARGEVRY